MWSRTVFNAHIVGEVTPKEEILAIRNVADTWHRAWHVISGPCLLLGPLMNESMAKINYLPPTTPLNGGLIVYYSWILTTASCELYTSAHVYCQRSPALLCQSPKRKVPTKWIMINQLPLWGSAAWVVLYFVENVLYTQCTQTFV